MRRVSASDSGLEGDLLPPLPNGIKQGQAFQLDQWKCPKAEQLSQIVNA